METTPPYAQVLPKLTHELHRCTSSAEIFRLAATTVPKLIPCDRSSITEYEPQSDTLTVIEVWGLDEHLQVGKINSTASPTAASGSKRSLSDQQVAYDPVERLNSASSHLLEKMGLNSVLNVPLVTGIGVIGSLNSASASHQYTDQHLLVLQRLASMVSSAVHNLELKSALDLATRRSDEYTSNLESINRLAEELVAVFTVDRAIQLVARVAKAIVPAHRISYIELAEDGETITIKGIDAVSPDHSLEEISVDKKGTQVLLAASGLEKSLLEGLPIHISELKSSRAPAHQALYRSGYLQLWSVPLHHGRSAPSTLAVASRHPKDETGDKTSLVHTLCKLLASTIERVDAQEMAKTSLRTMIDDSPTMLLALDPTGKITSVSRFGAAQFGYSADAIGGDAFEALHPLWERDAVRQRIKEWSVSNLESVTRCETQMKLKDGSLRWVRQTARLTHNLMQQAQILVACEDINDIRQMATELEVLARTDPITKLPNRNDFTQQVSKRVHQCKDPDKRYAIMFMDLDHFKKINDSLGHHAGDEVLKIVAQRMQSVKKEQDLIARIGGDEFLMLIEDPGDAEKLNATAEKLITEIGKSIPIGNQKFELGISIGSTCYPDDGVNTTELIKKADIAMYQAKSSGRNQVRAFCSDMLTELTTEMSLETDLRMALKKRQLSVVFQPKVNIKTGVTQSLEALVRWNHEERGFIPPDVFIPIAEKYGLISVLTEYVLSESLKVVKELRREHHSLSVAVNISAIEFAAPESLKERVLSALERYKLPASALELELTETALLKHPIAAAALIRELSDRGVIFAIDDFGTGYASLSYLVKLPIKAIKIDRSFVADLVTDKRKQSVVSGIIGIADGLDVNCIAEGVEDPNQAQWLMQNNCHLAQGYLYCKPVPEKELVEFLGVTSPQFAA